MRTKSEKTMEKLRRKLEDAIYKRTSQSELELLDYIRLEDDIMVELVRDVREGVTQETKNDIIVLTHATNHNEHIRINRYNTEITLNGETELFGYSYEDNLVLWNAILMVHNVI